MTGTRRRLFVEMRAGLCGKRGYSGHDFSRASRRPASDDLHPLAESLSICSSGAVRTIPTRNAGACRGFGPGPSGEDVSMNLIAYIDLLQRRNADDLAFYPLSTLEKAIGAGQVLVAEENGEPCGYLWCGSIRSGWPVTIYQACIDYEVRRREKGWDLVRQLIAFAQAGGATAIRLKCASSALSNEFWQAIGFRCVNVTQGGIKRARQLNHWWTPVAPTLFLPETVIPSDAPIDLTAYQRMKREGVAMPSRFSRKHYR